MTTVSLPVVPAPIMADSDPAETQEWLDAFDAILRVCGRQRCHELLVSLTEHARRHHINIPPLLNTPYCNTIARTAQPVYPGDLDLERRITALVRWNALAMVVRANKYSTDLGGHLASYGGHNPDAVSRIEAIECDFESELIY